jgi:integrase
MNVTPHARDMGSMGSDSRALQRERERRRRQQPERSVAQEPPLLDATWAARGCGHRAPMVAAGLAPGTVHTRVQNVRSVLRGAVRDRLIASDPSEGVPLPRRRRRAQAMSIPTPAQVGALLAAADERFATFIALCAFAGLRLGEAAAVQVDDIDFLRRRLVVRRQVQRGTGGSIGLRAPKHGSERTVTLPDSLLELLAAHIEHHVSDDDPDGWLFRTPNGTPPHQNNVGHQWRKATRASGLEGLRLHNLRHFYASGLITSGCDVVTVQPALGHENATLVLKTYGHLMPDSEDRTRRAIDEAWCAISVPSGQPEHG